MSKQIEQITDDDLAAVWGRIGGTPHLFDAAKNDLKSILIHGVCEDHGLQLDYYTMAAITDTLRIRGYETIIYTDAG
jgi:hypothetical protein